MIQTRPSGAAHTGADLEAVRAEHRQVSAWLLRLDEVLGDAPEHVVEQVRADYVQRLDGLVGQLAARIARVEEAVGAAEARFTEAADRLAEHELRVRTGEVDAGTVKRVAAEVRAEMKGAAEERRELRNSLPALRELLDELKAARPAGPAEASAAPAPPTPDAREMFGEWEAPRPIESLAPDSEPPAAPPAEAADDLDFLSTLPASEAPAAAKLDEGRKPKGRPAPVRTTQASAGIIRPDAALGCRMCGGLNDPRAWYCDTCGAELG